MTRIHLPPYQGGRGMSIRELFAKELKARNFFTFPSESMESVEYAIWRNEEGNWKCNCSGFVPARKNGGLCKHIKWWYKYALGHPVQHYWGKKAGNLGHHAKQ